MNAILSYPDHTLTATLSTGSWNASYPLNNLKDSRMTKVVRSSNLLIASTQFKSDLGLIIAANGISVEAPTVRCIALLNHNCSFDATIRVRGYSDSSYSNLVSGSDTGVINLWPQTLTAKQFKSAPNNWTYCLPAGVRAKYWLTEIVDLYNPATHVEFGRFWLGSAFQPNIGISYGATLGYESRDIVTESLGGSFWGEKKQPRRTNAVKFDYLITEEKREALYMQKDLTTSTEVLWIANSAAAPEDMLHEAFPALMKQASQLSYPYFEAHELPMELMEILGNDRVKTIPTVITFQADLISDLLLTIGTGTATHTRASKAYQPDFENNIVPVMDNCPAFPGLRAVTNLQPFSNSINGMLGNGVLTFGNVTNVGNVISESADIAPHIIQTNSKPAKDYIVTFRIKPGTCTRVAIRESGYTGIIAIFDLVSGTIVASLLAGVAVAYIKAEDDGSYSCSLYHPYYPDANYYFALHMLNPTDVSTSYGDLAHAGDTSRNITFISVQLQDVTGQSNKLPAEYVENPSNTHNTKWFPYYNPFTVDANGVVTDSMLRTPIAPVLGSDVLSSAQKVCDSGYDFLSGTVTTNGKLNFNSTPSDTGARLLGVLEVNKVYAITYTIDSVSGSIKILAGNTTGSSRTFPGTYTEYLMATVLVNLHIYSGTNNTTAVLDNFSIKEVTADKGFALHAKGYLGEPASTNKCTCYGVPQISDTVGVKSFYSGGWTQGVTNMTISGDTAAVLSIVTDQAEIDAAGLAGMVNGGKVYKIDNTTGVTPCYVIMTGQVANLNAHSFSAMIRTPTLNIGNVIYLSGGLGVVVLSNSTYARVKSENIIPANTTDQMIIQVNAGQTAFFFLPQLEEQIRASSIIPTAGATATRAATALPYPTAGNMSAANGTLFLEYTGCSDNGVYLAQFGINIFGAAATYVAVLGTGITNIIASGTFPTRNISKLALAWNSTGVKLFVNGVLAGSSATPFTGSLAADLTLALDNYIKDVRVCNRALTDAQCIELTT